VALWRGPPGRSEISLESIEQVKEAKALPGPISAPNRHATEHTGVLQSTDREARSLLAAPEQLPRRLHVDDRLRRKELDQAPGTRTPARASSLLDPVVLQLSHSGSELTRSFRGPKQCINEDEVPVLLVSGPPGSSSPVPGGEG
jgi:hypothetical protein